MEKPSSTMNLSPFDLLVDVFLSHTSLDRLCRVQKFFSRQCLSKLGGSTYSCDSDEKSPNENEVVGDVCTEEAEMVMGRLGLCCNSESEELKDRLSSKEFVGLFDEKEPSLEEVKEAFNVFDENRDGFIDARELQRVMVILGFKEGSDVQNCQRMIRTFDRNADGRIDFNEFVKFMENSFC